MQGKPQIPLISFEYGADGSLHVVLPAPFFEALRTASYEALDDGRRVSVNVGDFGYRVKDVRFVLMSDQPPCDPP